MPATEMVVMVGAFAALLLGFFYLTQLIASAITHRTIRKVAERDPAAVEPLLSQLATSGPARTDDRTGVLLIAVGVALVTATLIIGEQEWIRYGVAGAMFPLIIGAALLVRHRLVERTRVDVLASGQ